MTRLSYHMTNCLMYDATTSQIDVDPMWQMAVKDRDFSVTVKDRDFSVTVKDRRNT